MKKSTIAMTAAIAAASLAHTVGAEEVAPKPVNVEAPKAEVVETTTPAVVTKEEVATKEAEAKKTDQAVVEAKQTVKDAKRATNEADSLVNEKTEAVKRAEDFAKTASPAVITEAEKAVVKAEAAVPAKAEAVKHAEAKATEASQAVSAQEAVVAEKEATQATKEKALTSATEAVQIATDAVNGKGLENAKEAQKEAVEAEKTSKQAQTDAETALKNAEEANQATQAQIKNTQADIATKTQAVSDAKAEQKKADKALKAITADLEGVLKSSKLFSKGSITLDTKIIAKVKESIKLKRDFDNSGLTGNQAAYDEYSVKSSNLEAEITQMIAQSIQSKELVIGEDDKSDSKLYDVNNLPKDIRDDLTLFAADLISGMREQLGLSDIVVTSSSFEFAEKVAKEYIKGGWSLDKFEEQRNRGFFGHYAKGIHAVADAYGLNGLHPTEEELNQGLQGYENSATYYNTSSHIAIRYLTKAEMKEKLFNSISLLVSTKHDFGHFDGTLQFTNPDYQVYFGGFAQSSVNELYINHVLGVTESEVKGSKFDTKEIANPYTVARKGDSTNTKLEAKKAEKAQAEKTLQNATDQLTSSESNLNIAKSNLRAQEAKLVDTVALKKALQSATTTHNQDVVTLSNANALVATLSATKAEKEAKLAELKATAQEAENEFNQSKAETKAEKATLSSLQEKAEEATQAVSVAKEALKEAKVQVASSKELVRDLKVAAKELEARKAELKDAEEVLKEAQANQTTAQEALEAKEKVAKEAHKAYATAKASYEAEQARLQAEELKKHPVTEKGIPEVRPALPEYILPVNPVNPVLPNVPSTPANPVAPVLPTTPRVEVPVVNNNVGVSGQDKAKVDVVAKQKTETKTTKDSQAGNWIESAGRWWYQHEDGSYTSNGWEQIKGTWYYFDNTGWMQTGWVKTGGSWYYLNETGSLATGWVKDNGTWYYLKDSGKMATGWVKDNDTWYYLDSAGAMKTGWFTVSGKWYYAYSSGALAVNTTTPDGYTVNGNGEWV
jgi:choline binding protein J